MLLWSSAQMSVASVQVIVDSRDTKLIIGMYDGVGPKFWCIKKSSAVRWQDKKCGFMIPLSIECTSSWWWHDDGRHGDKHDLRIMVLIINQCVCCIWKSQTRNYNCVVEEYSRTGQYWEYLSQMFGQMHSCQFQSKSSYRSFSAY